MQVTRAAVVGAGTMGGEIAHVIADAGIPVILTDIDQGAVEHGLAKARSLWATRVEAGKLDQAEFDRRLSLITATTGYDALGAVEFVIEAVPERIGIKQQVFAELDAATPGHAILATNTSSLSISEIADATARPDRVVGFHFFYPASLMKLIEIVEGDATSDATLRTAANFAQAIKKVSIAAADVPGFVVNRVLMAAMSEMFRTQEELGLPAEEIDRLVVESKAGPIGPFRLADMLGLDTVLHVAEHLHDSYGERFHVPERLRELVAAGDLGAKTGKGFYDSV